MLSPSVIVSLIQLSHFIKIKVIFILLLHTYLIIYKKRGLALCKHSKPNPIDFIIKVEVIVLNNIDKLQNT